MPNMELVKINYPKKQIYDQSASHIVFFPEMCWGY